MSKPQVYLWLPSIAEAIAGNQSVPNGGSLVLNANTPGTPGVFSYRYTLTANPNSNKDVIRNISFKSQAGSDNSGVTFVITGIGVTVDASGNPTNIVGPITENVAGPGDGATVSSMNIYTQINSIAVSAADSNNISVGLGPSGITPYVSIDTNRTMSQIQTQLQVYQRVTLEIDVNVSLNKPESPGVNGELIPFGTEEYTHNIFLPAFKIVNNATASVLQPVVPPVSTIWATVRTTGATEAFILTVLQQGTNSQ